MNPLDLFQDPEVTDVLIDSHRKIQVVKAGLIQTQSTNFGGESELQSFAKTVIRDSGGRIDLAKPFADVSVVSKYGRLRFHALLGEECSSGTQISIRRHPTIQLSLEDLQNIGSVTQIQSMQLKKLVIERANFVIIGATGSGKTTLLRAMLSYADNERIITIEDNQELKIANAIELYTREPNPDGFGAITLEMLVREALRMRPDRLVIGEARGSEILTLLQAMNTGHDGVGFTLHAKTSGQAISRMLGLMNLAGASESLAKSMISSSIDYLIALNSGDRKVISIEKLSLA